MKNLYILVLFPLLLLGACNKKELDFTVKGTMTQQHNNQPLSGATIKAYISGMDSNAMELKDEVKTDAAGNYELTIARSRFENLTLEIHKTNYFPISKKISFSQLSTANDNIYDFEVSPQSWVQFEFKNLAPASENDELKIQKVSGKTDCEDCCDDGFYYYHGVVDTTVICPNDGGTYLKFYYWVNNNVQYGVDSVFCTPFETEIYELNY